MGLVHFENGQVLYYPYTPSSTVGYLYMAFFAIATIVHFVWMVRLKLWFFISMILGGLCEVFGHYGRAWAGERPNSPKPFMLQLMLILVAPVFISATVYVTLSKFKQALLGAPKRSCSPTTFFILTDILAFCTQIGGSLVQVTGNPKVMAIGGHVVLGGLIFQLVVLAVYLVLVLRFERKCRLEVFDVDHWRRYVWMLAICVVAIWVRNLVRAIEFAQDFRGFVNSHEPMLYVFDSSLMLFVLVIFAVLHPGLLLQRSVIGRSRKLLPISNAHAL